MIHRSRRLATLPARRGMRAPWLRCRIPDELEDAVAGDPSPPTAPPPPDGPGSSGPTQDGAASPTIVRPAFGHPTF